MYYYVWYLKRHYSIFSAILPILVRMLRTRKNQMVVTPIIISATQKATSQLCRLAMVLKGNPAMKAPTENTQEAFAMTDHL